jgi:Zinc finger, C3HC4 type (RING finger)
MTSFRTEKIIMNRGFLIGRSLVDDPLVNKKNELEKKLLEIRFSDLSRDSMDTLEPLEDEGIQKHIEPYTKMVDKLLDAQTKLDRAKDEHEDLLVMSKRFGHSPKLKNIIDEYIAGTDVASLEEQVRRCASEVARYRSIFSLCTDIDVLNRYMCFICLSSPVDTFLLGCGHVLCNRCADHIASQCPFCRVTIRDKLRMFVVS